MSPAEDPSLVTALQAGDLSADCNFQSTINSTPESNRERTHFQKLVQQYTKELQTICQQHEQHAGVKGPRLDVLEVFCGPQSQLTAQAQKLGYRAERFGMLQGDLQTLQGRETLFQKMVVHRPLMSGFHQLADHGVASHVSMAAGQSNRGTLCSKTG